MLKDIEGQVVNFDTTYEDIAIDLKVGNSVLIGWTDEAYTHHDILFALSPVITGDIQGGLKSNYLFVSIMRCGAFGFRLDMQSEPSYYGEKLFLSGAHTQLKIAELINGVKRYLNGYK